MLIGGILVLSAVGGGSKWRLGLLDENIERNFSFFCFVGDRSFFGGVDMTGRGRPNDFECPCLFNLKAIV
jgi:hypothetical protein